VQDWLIENLEKKCTIAELSSIANMGERNLTRVFKKTTGLTINQYTKELRLEKLRTLLHNTELKSDALANKIGYKNARQLRRIKNSREPF
jgi:transcriptional regulator GlxA family with amidase domain